MASKKFEQVSNIDSLLSSARAQFEKVLWDAFRDGDVDPSSREFQSAMFNYVFWLEDTLSQHFQIGLTKDRFDLHRWKHRRQINQIGQTNFHFDEPGGYPLH